ncbi:hypothetical protein [Marivirga tractuosa]|uniref:hypothetical protein n=1 Tax=Marivirga tractuosa TaxID=1006 RepID=UPI0011D207B5|nr:hypothetical protein [Marivirga tractuosa]
MQTIIKRQKWKIPGISFNGNKNSQLKIFFSNRVNCLSKSDFHKSLTQKDFFQLIDLKESILESNEFSSELCSFLRILNLQINRLKDSAYSLANINNVDINKQHNVLTKLYQSIKDDLIRIKRIESLETKKFHINEKLTNFLDAKLESIAVRIHQIHFEESLPQVEYPALHRHDPKNWCKIIEEKVWNHKDPYNTVLWIRLQLDRIKDNYIHLHQIEIVKNKNKSFQDIKNHAVKIPIENYVDEINNLLNKLPDAIERAVREENISTYKSSVSIKNKPIFKKCIKFMVDYGLIEFNYTNIDWLIYSICSNHDFDLDVDNELPAGSIYIFTKDSVHDVRMIFQYMLSHGYMGFKVADQLNALLRELISTTAKGNKAETWKKNISKAKEREMQTISFKNSHITFTEFKSFILN